MDSSEIEIKVDHTYGLDVVAYWRGIRVGSARSIRDGDQLHLCDVTVRSNLVRVRRGFGIFRFLLPKRRVSARNKGIGNLLLDRLISEADQTGILHIWGSIVDHDFVKSPFLVKWYSDHGFTVMDAPANNPEGAVKHISRSRVLAHAASSPSSRVRIINDACTSRHL